MKPCTFSFSMQLLTLAFLLLVGACSKKDENSKPAATSFSWTADNTNYTATTTTATVQGPTLSLDATATSGSDSNGITLSVPAMAGTYTTVGASNTVNYSMFYFIKAGNASVLYMASNGGNIGSGTVTITTFSATDIIGTFSFTGSTLSSGLTKDVTNGKFSIKR